MNIQKEEALKTISNTGKSFAEVTQALVNEFKKLTINLNNLQSKNDFKHKSRFF